MGRLVRPKLLEEYMKTHIRINGVVIEEDYKKFEETSVLLSKLQNVLEDDTFKDIEDVKTYLARLKVDIGTRYQERHTMLRGMFKDRNLGVGKVASLLGISLTNLSLKLNGHRDFTEKDKDDILRLLGFSYDEEIAKMLFEEDYDD